jgi:2,4-dienoyl-CoA reductase-like NADH-dependent reductase (Old Yellow Enzyme family)
LAEVGIDLIEISGGTYENPEMATGANTKQSTREREAFFLDFAAKARAVTSVPLAVTGGFRSTAGIAGALRGGALDMVGLGRALVIDPEFAQKVLAGQPVAAAVQRIETGIGFVDRSAMMETVWYSRQLRRIGAGLEPAPNASPLLTLAGSMAKQGLGAFRNRMRA